MDKNLGTNILFMLDAIVDADMEEPDSATMNVALALTHFAWNREIQGDSITSKNYKKVFRESEKVNPSLWNELARKSSEELIDILTKRKKVFFPDDKRLIRSCFYNMLGTITVVEDNDEGTVHIGK